MALTVYLNVSAGWHDNYSLPTTDFAANESTSTVVATTAEVHCTLFGDADQQQWKCDTMVTVRRISASLSLIGCAAIISTIWLFGRNQLFVQRLLLYLSISGAISNVAYWLGDSRFLPDGATCNFEAFLLTFGEWSLLFWTSLVVFNACANTLWAANTEQSEWLYHVVGWAIPFAISTSPLFGDHYGPAGAWCWIQQDDWSWRVGLWNVPSCVLVLLQVVAIVIVALVIRKPTLRWRGTYNLEVERATIIIKEYVKPLLPYPIIYLCTSIVPVINRIRDTVDPQSKPVFAIEVLQCFLCPLSGALNAILFMADKEARSKLTWLQIKAAWQRNTNQQRVIREYPIMYRMDDKVCNGENKVVQFLRYDRVEYQKLQGMACKGQSCLEAD